MSKTKSTAERISNFAVLLLLTLAALQGTYIIYRINNPSIMNALPTGVKNFKGQSLPDLNNLLAVSSKDSIQNELNHRTILVAFLNPQCSSCKEANPSLKLIANKYNSKVGLVAMFGVDGQDVVDYDLNFPKFFDKDRKILDSMKLMATPTFFIQRDGKVVYQFVGWTDQVGKDIEKVLSKGI